MTGISFTSESARDLDRYNAREDEIERFHRFIQNVNEAPQPIVVHKQIVREHRESCFFAGGVKPCHLCQDCREHYS